MGSEWRLARRPLFKSGPVQVSSAWVRHRTDASADRRDAESFQPTGHDIETQTFRFEHYDLTCSAQACDNGMFQPTLVVSKNAWPNRLRTIATRRDRHLSADVAIESARAQGLEWVRNYG